MKKNEAESTPDRNADAGTATALESHALHVGARGVGLADSVTRRCVDAMAEQVLDRTGVISRAAKLVGMGASCAEATDVVLPTASGHVAEIAHVADFNRAAGLQRSPLIARQHPQSNHPRVDVQILYGTSVEHEFQLKVGADPYVEHAARSGKYPGPIVTTPEAAEALRGRAAVVDRIEAGGVASRPTPRAELSKSARRTIQRRIAKAVPELSSWEAVATRLKESAPAALGGAAVSVVVELIGAHRRGDSVKASSVVGAAVRGAADGFVLDQIGRALMAWLESRATAAGGWTQLQVKKLAGWATPAAALAGFIWDAVKAAWKWLNGGMTTEQFLHHLASRFGAALFGLIGATVGYVVGAWFHPLLGLVLAGVGGYYGGREGEKLGVMMFDGLKRWWNDASSAQAVAV